VVLLFFIFAISPAAQNGPEIDINKYTNGEDADEAPGPFIPVGDPVEWRYEVRNSGDVELHDVAVSDNQFGPICSVSQLPVEASMICYAYGTAQAGQYENIGTVAAFAPNETPLEDSDSSHYFGGTAAIDIEKYTNGEDADEAPGPFIFPGEPVEWEYLVKNIGNVDLTDVTVSDDQDVLVECPEEILQSGESMTCKAEGFAEAGQYENIGTVVALPPSGPEVEDSDASHYFGKLAVPVDIKPGSCPNPLNTKSKGKLPVAILGTDSFDVSQIDPSTVRLEGVTPIRWSLDDVGTPFDPHQDKEDCYTDCNELGPDGFTDLTLKFKRQAVLEALGDVDDRDCLVLTVTGNLKDEYGGASIIGEDVLLILKKGKKNGKKKKKKKNK